MKIGVFVPLANPVATPDYIRTLGSACDERGIASIWVAEHVVLFDDHHSKYPYSEDGRFPVAGEVGILDPFVALSYLAACTKTARLGTGIVLAPQRNPVYTAKEAATVDWLSDGRLDLGLGIGWLEEEFEALQVPFARRGARCRDYIRVMQSLWCDAVSQHDGEFYRLPACRQYPKPVQKPYPPIHFGGESDAALRRVADFGRGWYGYNIDPTQTAERIGHLERLLGERGRRLDEVEVSICPYLAPVDLDLVKKYADIGVDQVIVFVLASDADELTRALDTLAEQIVVPAGGL
jgi:probable F420-dependent oxidoreductase